MNYQEKTGGMILRDDIGLRTVLVLTIWRKKIPPNTWSRIES